MAQERSCLVYSDQQDSSLNVDLVWWWRPGNLVIKNVPITLVHEQ